MNIPRFLLATVTAFIFIVGFEWYWHASLMKDLYESTKSVWRQDSDGYMAYLFASQLLFASIFTLIYTCVGKHLCCKKGVQYGLFAGLLIAAPELGTQCYLPIPLNITLLWMLATILKCVGAGIVVAFFYKDELSS